MIMKRSTSDTDSRCVLWPDLDRLPAPSPEPTHPQRRALHEALRAAIDEALTEKQREAVTLHYFEGLSQSEIARRLGVSQQVVQRRLHGDRRGGKVVGGALPRLAKALAGACP
ncbi:MAG: sigma-70 family RNA polymerase sigma factor [Alphaproteobacteria bacterium]|nr:sigma-70 family RNA polymerase sigma factor [Alphaproteobacteria bacterium]